MMDVSRREMLALAGAGTVGVILRGSSPLVAQVSQRLGLTQDTAEMIDPWLELNLDHLANNIAEVSRRVEGRPIMAVVKCNAYGHGTVEMATAMAAHGLTHFAVVKTAEALALRQHGIEGMILNFGPFSRPEARALVEHDISQSVFSEAIDVLADAARTLGKRARVHIKVDTGLGRVGVPTRDALAFIEQVTAMPDVLIEGIFTALTEDEEMDRRQIERLQTVYEGATRRGIDLGIRHAAATAEVDRYPFAYLDMVRPGNCLYGLEPHAQTHMTIKPVMTFKTRVLLVKTMSPGESVGYHQAFKVEHESRIATLPAGYSDGYPPDVPGKADVLIKGKRYPVVGLVTANHMEVDVTGAEEIKIGDEVVLWGQQDGAEITKTELTEVDPGANEYRMCIRTRTYLPRKTV